MPDLMAGGRPAGFVPVPGVVPRINRRQPLAKGLVGLWYPAGGNLIVDLTGAAPLTVNGSPTNGVGAAGYYAADVSGGYWSRASVPAVQQVQNFSLLYLGKDLGTGGGGNLNLLGVSLPASPYAAWLFFVDHTTGNLALGWNYGTGFADLLWAAPVSGTDYALVGTVALGNEAQMWNAGAPVASASIGSGSPQVYTSGTIILGGIAGGPNAGFGFSLGAVWNRALSAVEAQALSLDPWQVLEWPADRLPTKSIATAATSYAVSIDRLGAIEAIETVYAPDYGSWLDTGDGSWLDTGDGSWLDTGQLGGGWASIEILSTPPGLGAEIEYLARLAADRPAPAESLGLAAHGAGTNILLPLEVGRAQTSDPRLPVATGTGLAADRTIEAESGTTLGADAETPLEAVTTVPADRPQPGEALLAVHGDATTPGENIALSVSERPTTAEAISAARIEGPAPAETVATAAANAALQEEISGIPTLVILTVDWLEWQASTVRDRTTGAEWAALSRSDMEPLAEIATGVAADRPAPAENGAIWRGDAEMPAETGMRQAIDRALAAEALVAAIRGAGRDTLAPVEVVAIGRGDAPAAIEAQADLSRAVWGAPAEAVARAAADAEAPIEAQGTAIRTELPIEWLVVAAADAAIRAEWAVLFGRHGFAVIETAALSASDKALVAGWLRGQAADPVSNSYLQLEMGNTIPAPPLLFRRGRLR